MQYILTQEELGNYVTKDEYDELQIVINQKDEVLNALWLARRIRISRS